MKIKYILNGQEVTREEALRNKVNDDWLSPKHSRKRSVGTCPGNWPMKSLAAGINPDYLDDQLKADKMLGVPTEYTKGGRAIFRSRGHRRDYLKAHKIHDNLGMYSD